MKGDARVKSFLAEHQKDMRWLFGTSTGSDRVALRKDLIRILSADGLNNSEISRVLKISFGTVRYWLQEDFRKYKIRNRQINHDRTKIYRVWEHCAQVLAEGARA